MSCINSANVGVDLAEQPPHRGQQGGRRERLAEQDLVGAQRLQGIQCVGPARRVEDRDVRPACLQQAGGLDTVQAAGHVDVRHEQGLWGRVRHDQGGRLAAVLGFVHRKAKLHQVFGERGADQPLVLDQQDAHGSDHPREHAAHSALVAAKVCTAPGCQGVTRFCPVEPDRDPAATKWKRREELHGAVVDGRKQTLPAERLGAGGVTVRLSPPDAAAVRPGFGEEASHLGSLGADVAHELANLLTVVAGSLEQLRRQPLDKRGQEQLARAEWGAWHAVQLTRQVLSQARGGDGKVEVVDLNAAVDGFVAIIGQQVDKRVQLVAELAPGRLPVRLDPALLDLVLLNLVRNAADAMPDGGTVVLRTRKPRLDGLGDQLATEVSVSDTGTGMAPAVAGRAAEAFFTTKPHGKGTGLGLWMAHRFASTCGGKITIETRQGQGTTIRLALPCCLDVEPS